MKLAGLLYDTCPNSPICPRIIGTDGDTVIVQGKKLADADERRAELDVPDDEDLVSMPADILDQVRLLDPQEFLNVLHGFDSRDILRVENRPQYLVESDGGDFERFRAGRTLVSEEHGDWLAYLDAQIAEGRTWRRIRMFEATIGDYGLYECHAFTDSVEHGEQIRALHHTDPGLSDIPDYFVLDGRHVLRHVYDEIGSHLGGVLVSGSDQIVYRQLAHSLYDRGTDFTTWWNAHPQYHRVLRAA